MPRRCRVRAERHKNGSVVLNGAHGAVAAGHEQTAAAAAEILADGGNAFDAALAGVLAACVTEPVLASPGGGGFLLARTAAGETALFDFFAQTPGHCPPASALDFQAIQADFGTVTQEFHTGLGSVAVPGLVAGIFDVHGALGYAPMDRIVAPAARLARSGVPLAPLQATIMDVVSPIMLGSSSARELFESRTTPGRVLETGAHHAAPDLADLFEALAAEGADLFYRGDVARAMTALCAEGGGILRMEDLAAYRVERRAPLMREIGGGRLATNPPPSSGGPLIAFSLLLAETAHAAGEAWPTSLVEAMRLTNQARRTSGLSDQSNDTATTTLLSQPFMETYRAQMPGRAIKVSGTTHLSVVDRLGNAAALSVSNGEGCGHIVPGAGFMLNNMLGEEDINPNGFFNWLPDTRISSMMAPTLLDLPGGGLVALGSGGSNRIRTAIVQVIVNLLWRGMSLPDAVDAPRLHYERGLLNIEAGHPADVVEGLTAAYPDNTVWPDRNFFFGGVHAAAHGVAGREYDGAGDARRGGVANVL